jgi:hypothetical protein
VKCIPFNVEPETAGGLLIKYERREVLGILRAGLKIIGNFMEL